MKIGLVLLAGETVSGGAEGYLTMRMMMYGCSPEVWRHPLSGACRAALLTDPAALLEAGALCKRVCAEMGLGAYPECAISLLVETPFAAVKVYEAPAGVPAGISSALHRQLAQYSVTSILLGGMQGPWEYAPHVARVAFGDAPAQWAKCSGNMDAGLVLTLSEPALVKDDSPTQFRVLLARTTHKPLNLTRAWARTVAVATF